MPDHEAIETKQPLNIIELGKQVGAIRCSDTYGLAIQNVTDLIPFKLLLKALASTTSLAFANGGSGDASLVVAVAP